MPSGIVRLGLAMVLVFIPVGATAQQRVLLKGVRFADGAALILPAERRKLVEACGPKFEVPLPGANQVEAALALVRRLFGGGAPTAADAALAYKIMDFPASNARLYTLDKFLAALQGRAPANAEPALRSGDSAYVLVWLAAASSSDRPVPAVVIFEKGSIIGVTVDPMPVIPMATPVGDCPLSKVE